MAKSATAQQVREFALANGIEVPARGRLSREVIAAFNKKGGQKFNSALAAKDRHLKVVKVKPAKGRTITRTVDVREVRKAAVEAGLAKDSRGRMKTEVFEAFVLGTLGN